MLYGGAVSTVESVPRLPTEATMAKGMDRKKETKKPKKDKKK
jgi:hypothetical protein